MKIEKDVISKLKTETKGNPAAASVFHLLALRERTRGTLTLGALSQRMKDEGFNFTKDQYRELLVSMAKAGIGTPQVNRNGNTVGIEGIKHSLTELGKAALDLKDSETPPELPKNRRSSDKHKAEGQRRTDIAFKPVMKLEMLINGAPAVIEFPNGLSPAELATVIEKLQGHRN